MELGEEFKFIKLTPEVKKQFLKTGLELEFKEVKQEVGLVEQ